MKTRFTYALAAVIMLCASTAQAQDPPITVEALAKVKKAALDQGSKLLVPTAIKKALGLSENQRLETKQIGVELEGVKHFFSVNTGDGDDIIISEPVVARADRAGGTNEKTTYIFLTNSKLRLRGVVRSVTGDQNPHQEMGDPANTAIFNKALEIWAQVAQGLP